MSALVGHLGAGTTTSWVATCTDCAWTSDRHDWNRDAYVDSATHNRDNQWLHGDFELETPA